jgi:hypothetical protein
MREGDTVVVITSIERYDEGGIIRIRVDGIRPDDDCCVSWPRILVADDDGGLISNAAIGDYVLADTLQVDIGFRPWIPDGTRNLTVTVERLRGPQGIVPPVVVQIPVENLAS